MVLLVVQQLRGFSVSESFNRLCFRVMLMRTQSVLLFFIVYLCIHL